MEELNCSKCGKSMTDEEGQSFPAILIQFPSGLISDPHIKKQFGKYASETKYQFCWECWLDSLFGVT